MPTDKDYMSIALDLARLGAGRTSPNPAVGAVIVKGDKILATGFHRKAGMPHAEIEAIRNVGAIHESPLRDATLYVTLEPCCHTGRTPPCTEAILKAGFREVVVGMRDPDVKVSGKGIRFLKKYGVKVREGVFRRECEELNEAYIKHRRTGIPFVILKSAMTLDGMVGLKSGRSKWITSPEARRFAHGMRDRVDAILVGMGTVKRDNPKLTTRLGKKGRDPVRIILDSHLSVTGRERIFHVKSKAPTWVVTTLPSGHPRWVRLRRIWKRGSVEVLSCRADREGRVDLKDLLKKLGKRGVMTLLVEGGPTVASSFIRRKLVDKIALFVAPAFLGENGLPLFSEIAIPSLSKMPRLKNISCREIGPDLLIEGEFYPTI